MGIVISTNDCPDEVKAKLQEEEKYLNSVGVNYNIEENKDSDYTLFEIDFEQENYTFDLKESLADIVAEIVVDSLEKKLITKIIRHDYQQFDLEERSRIKEFTLENLDQKSNLGHSLFSKIIRKKEIINQILDYFEQSDDLNIEGFVRFRLKNYTYHLELAVEEAVDDYLVEKEYDEFIELLKYFVDIQEPKMPLVNILKKEDNSFQILNSKNEVIANEYLEGYIADLLDEEVEEEDLLISALINTSPAQIILHFDDKEIENTVKSIFGNKVSVCHGCELCRD